MRWGINSPPPSKAPPPSFLPSPPWKLSKPSILVFHDSLYKSNFLVNAQFIRFYCIFYVKIAIPPPPPPPPEKSHLLLSKQPPSKSWGPVKPTLFENLVGGSPPSLPAERGVGEGAPLLFMTLVLFTSTRHFCLWQLTGTLEWKKWKKEH